MRSLFAVIPVCMAAVAMAAEPQLAPIFSPGMVLQRDMPVVVWGTADAGTAVKVDLGGQTAETQAADGAWRVQLPARKASAEPVTMTVTFSGQGEPKVVTVGDVLVGEVWLCAGQSNMAQIINKRAPRPVEDMPTVRQFKSDPYHKEVPRWTPAVGDEVKRFSITSLYFGEQLHKELKVPVGLVLTAISGTPIEKWIPRDTLEADAKIKATMDKLGDRDERQKMTEMHKGLREGKELTPDQYELMAMFMLSEGGRLYDRVLGPTVPYGIRGVIWYQGEANAKRDVNAAKYARYLGMLVRGLREKFGQPDLPFYVVQLPSIDSRKGEQVHYEWIRQQQLEAVRTIPNTGLAVTIDINQGLHPRNKDITGDRLAMLALARTYHLGKQGVPDSGPLLAGVTFQNGAAVCRFDDVQGGLVLKDGDKDLFQVAGPDGAFQPAAATVQDGTLTVRGDKVPNPTAVRYAYQPVVPKPTLFGSTGLPASPFLYVQTTK